jgi:TolB protein
VTKSKWTYVLIAALIAACGCMIAVGIFGPGIYRILTHSIVATPDYEATLQSLIGEATASSSPGEAAPEAAASSSPSGATPEATVSSGEPAGKIVYTCQDQSSEDICIMNADGSGSRRPVAADGYRRFYPSLAPDGKSVVYSQYREDNVYEIYELPLATGVPVRLTDRLGVLNAPEISPDGRLIAFMRDPAAADQYQIWVMDRDGSNPRRVYSGRGWDPTWSPDGDEILFASDKDGSNQLYRIHLDGSKLQRVSDLPAIRGRSDWSPQDMIVTYSGASWKREVYVMRADGSGTRQLSPSGGNSQGPSFSPDGQWVAFTAYFDKYGDNLGCEIYIIRIDGTDLRRLTNNAYCDYQPRWGP